MLPELCLDKDSWSQAMEVGEICDNSPCKLCQQLQQVIRRHHSTLDEWRKQVADIQHLFHLFQQQNNRISDLQAENRRLNANNNQLRNKNYSLMEELYDKQNPKPTNDIGTQTLQIETNSSLPNHTSNPDPVPNLGAEEMELIKRCREAFSVPEMILPEFSDDDG